ncbi:hypothetical protein LDENG_00104340 [Lucifuga dentata]|nr:hypothetical protein LDENG_00104340 [Lucifuga dentata]
MTGRGKPCKAKSLDEKSPTRPELLKQASPPSCSSEAFVEEKQYDAKEEQKPKKREQKKPNLTRENPSAPSVQRQKCTEAKTRAGKAKSARQAAKTLKKQETAEEKDLDRILSTTLKKLKIKQTERSEAATVINRITKIITDHLKSTVCFKDVKEPLHTGSYYENVKIANPDEFDVMLPMPVDRVDIQPFGDDGAFYSVRLKRGKNPLNIFQQEGSALSASEMLRDFRDEVKKSIKSLENVEVQRKKPGCPAVTLLIREVGSVPISMDVVLCLVVKSGWPSFTKEGLKIEMWLGKKVRQKCRYFPYYLVPKYEGRGTVEIDGVLAKDVWRISFSHVEKDILKNHGSKKTCCELNGARCCRKDCLKLLKHLLSLLKNTHSTFNKFCSYYAKTTLLHACCSRYSDSDWEASRLSQCFQLLLDDFEHYLTEGLLPNFFIPTQNLLSGLNQRSCNALARCIREERDKGFPIFLEKEN